MQIQVVYRICLIQLGPSLRTSLVYAQEYIKLVATVMKARSGINTGSGSSTGFVIKSGSRSNTGPVDSRVPAAATEGGT